MTTLSSEELMALRAWRPRSYAWARRLARAGYRWRQDILPRRLTWGLQVAAVGALWLLLQSPTLEPAPAWLRFFALAVGAYATHYMVLLTVEVGLGDRMEKAVWRWGDVDMSPDAARCLEECLREDARLSDVVKSWAIEQDGALKGAHALRVFEALRPGEWQGQWFPQIQNGVTPMLTTAMAYAHAERSRQHLAKMLPNKPESVESRRL